MRGCPFRAAAPSSHPETVMPRPSLALAAVVLPLAAALATAPALAQQAEPPGAVDPAADSDKLQPPEPLRPGDIQAFIKSVPEVQRWAMRQDAPTRELTERRFDAETLAATPFAVGLAEIQDSDAYDELTDTVRAHGFTDAEQWAGTADRVMRALAALQMEASGPTPDQLDQTRRQVLNNPAISAQEKEQIVSSIGMATAMRTAPEGDVTAVQPFAEQLAEALGGVDGGPPEAPAAD